MRARPTANPPSTRATTILARTLLVLVIVVVPGAGAAVPFALAWDDPAGDVEAPSADVVRFESSVREGVVTQRVVMAGTPDPVQDTLILRSWFHNSTNGSFHVVDLEMHAHAEGDAKFRALVRRGAFENETAIEATYAVEGNAWVFTFSETLVADASCFDPIVWSQHEPDNGSWAADQGGIGTRYCRVRGDPTPMPTNAAPTRTAAPGGTSAGTAGAPEPRVEARPYMPPGSSSPPFSPWLVLALVAIVGALTFRISRRS